MGEAHGHLPEEEEHKAGGTTSGNFVQIDGKDIVKITLRSNPSLKPHENPKVVTDILKQHFSSVSCSSMPLADFYSTVPVAGENPVEYWIRLNKADAAEESLSRQGRYIDDPCREVTMMFVKHCPDPSLAAVLRFKAPEKWTAGEIQEHVDRYQIDMRERLNNRPYRPGPVGLVTAHVQTPVSEEAAMPSKPVIPPVQAEQESHLLLISMRIVSGL